MNVTKYFTILNRTVKKSTWVYCDGAGGRDLYFIKVIITTIIRPMHVRGNKRGTTNILKQFILKPHFSRLYKISADWPHRYDLPLCCCCMQCQEYIILSNWSQFVYKYHPPYHPAFMIVRGDIFKSRYHGNHMKHWKIHLFKLLGSRCQCYFWLCSIGETCWATAWNTVLCRYKEVNFLKTPHKRHTIARPLEQCMGCLLW